MTDQTLALDIDMALALRAVAGVDKDLEQLAESEDDGAFLASIVLLLRELI